MTHCLREGRTARGLELVKLIFEYYKMSRTVDEIYNMQPNKVKFSTGCVDLNMTGHKLLLCSPRFFTRRLVQDFKAKPNYYAH